MAQAGVGWEAVLNAAVRGRRRLPYRMCVSRGQEARRPPATGPGKPGTGEGSRCACEGHFRGGVYTRGRGGCCMWMTPKFLVRVTYRWIFIAKAGNKWVGEVWEIKLLLQLSCSAFGNPIRSTLQILLGVSRESGVTGGNLRIISSSGSRGPCRRLEVAPGQSEI